MHVLVALSVPTNVSIQYVAIFVLMITAGSKKGVMTGRLKDPPPYEGTEVTIKSCY